MYLALLVTLTNNKLKKKKLTFLSLTETPEWQRDLAPYPASLILWGSHCHQCITLLLQPTSAAHLLDGSERGNVSKLAILKTQISYCRSRLYFEFQVFWAQVFSLCLWWLKSPSLVWNDLRYLAPQMNIIT